MRKLPQIYAGFTPLQSHLWYKECAESRGRKLLGAGEPTLGVYRRSAAVGDSLTEPVS